MHLTLDLNFKDFILWTGSIYFGAFACWATIEFLFIVLFIRKTNNRFPALLLLGNLLAIMLIPVKGAYIAFREFVDGDMVPLALLNMAETEAEKKEEPPKE